MSGRSVDVHHDLGARLAEIVVSPGVKVGLAMVVTGVAVWFGTGLDVVPQVTWVMPLPMLLVATLARGPVIAVCTASAWAVGMVNILGYSLAQMETAPLLAVAMIAGHSAVAAAEVTVFRALVLRGRLGWAMVSVPSIAVAAEYVTSLIAPDGLFFSVAYTQADGPLLPIASITGGWGITALLYAVPTSIAVLATQLRQQGDDRIPTAGVVAVASVVAFGMLLSLTGAAIGRNTGIETKVAAVSLRHTGSGSADADSADGRRMVAATVLGIQAARSAGAQLVVLPNSAIRVDDTQLHRVTKNLRAAAGSNVRVVIGVDYADPSGRTRPQTLLLSPHRKAVVYESDDIGTVAGADDGSGDPALWGLAIVHDLDTTSGLQASGDSASDLWLVPASDADDDTWMHSRVAMVRSVENGAALVRAARNGNPTISNQHGQIVAESADAGQVASIASGSLHLDSVRTPYARFGDWLGWLALFAAVASVAALRLPPRSPQGS